MPPRAVLVVDGVFLLVPALRDAWTLSVHLHVSDEEPLRRGVARDANVTDRGEVERRYRERYLPAQALYRTDVDPRGVANFAVEHVWEALDLSS